MFARIAIALAAALVAVAAQAAEADYGACTQNIERASALIAPATPVSSTKVSEETVVLLIGSSVGETVVPVSKTYQGALYALLTSTPTKTWLGVIEGVDGNGDPALWMNLWVEAHRGCFHGLVGERVYDERANAPIIFWGAVAEWEREHPEDILIRAK